MTTACVILDIGGVLELTPETGWVRSWEERLALPPGGIAERMGDVWRAGRIGEVEEAEVERQVALRLGLDEAGRSAFLADLWTAYLGTPNDGLVSYVRALKGSCRLGILSNSFVGAREREAARYHYDDWAERIVYSHEIGFEKPDPRAYRAVCAALGVRPEDCLFVDDSPVCTEGAETAGMRAHLFRDTAGTVARIAEHLARYGGGHGNVRA
ncbi:HAD-IA family hydrolase [Kitasatospora sp. NPDC096147]|uniref:HAD-IA family hydrolase n=1 Tax=Kitasatospora sp. NPDC096147 TaxID=3364093 RepID=UPI003816C634